MITTLLSMFFSGIVGFAIGYIFRGIIDGRGDRDSATIVLVVVSIAWLISVLYDISSPEYQTPIEIHALMGAIVGYFYKQQKDYEKKA